MDDGECGGEVMPSRLGCTRSATVEDCAGADVGWDVVCKHANDEGSGGILVYCAHYCCSVGAGLIIFYISACAIALST